MAKASFVLHETFRSKDDAQRRQNFQKEFERFVVDVLSGAVPPPCADCSDPARQT